MQAKGERYHVPFLIHRCARSHDLTWLPVWVLGYPTWSPTLVHRYHGTCFTRFNHRHPDILYSLKIRPTHRLSPIECIRLDPGFLAAPSRPDLACSHDTAGGEATLIYEKKIVVLARWRRCLVEALQGLNLRSHLCWHSAMCCYLHRT